jgi:hypothetical protein
MSALGLGTCFSHEAFVFTVQVVWACGLCHVLKEVSTQKPDPEASLQRGAKAQCKGRCQLFMCPTLRVSILPNLRPSHGLTGAGIFSNRLSSRMRDMCSSSGPPNKISAVLFLLRSSLNTFCTSGITFSLWIGSGLTNHVTSLADSDTHLLVFGGSSYHSQGSSGHNQIQDPSLRSLLNVSSHLDADYSLASTLAFFFSKATTDSF